MKNNDNEKNHCDCQQIVPAVVAGTGMAVAGGVVAALCPPALVVLSVAALFFAAVGSRGDGKGK